MRYLSVLRRTLLLLALGLVAQTLDAQGTASLSGVVRDKSGGALPGATVVLQDAKGGAQRSAQADGEGKYSFSGLAPGSYGLTASLDGFAAAEAKLTLAAGQASTQDFNLEMLSFFENVTVTAQKREEQILDVPASITAVAGKSFEQMGITNIKDIAATVPSLSITEDAPGHQRAQIRSISSPLGLPTIGVYLDEAPINLDAAGSGTDVQMIDLERVEVLRGPQGTLYGEGSMGGTIKYVTRDADTTTTGGMVDGGYGTVSNGTATYRGSLVLNVPVVKEKFGLRIVAAESRAPGWVDYPALNEEDVNTGVSKLLRVKGTWIASDTVTASLLLQGQDADFDGQNYSDPDGTAPFKIAQPVQTKSKIANLVINWDAGAFTLLSSTSYMNRTDNNVYDYSLVFGYFVPYDTMAWVGSSDADVWSEEVRLASKGTGKLSWTAGMFYRDYQANGGGATVMTPAIIPDPYSSFTDTTSKQSAVFGEISYAFAKKLSATLGARYFHDDREQQTTTGYFGPPAVGANNSGTFDSTDPRLVLSYRPTEGTLVYASAAKGFRSGGFNDGLPPQCTLPGAFKPETLWTYEVGSSASLANGQFVVQGAVYRNDWQDIQTLTLCPGIPIRATGNIGKAEGTGLDLQLTISPARGLRFTLSGNTNDSHYVGTALAHNDGDQIDFAPKYNYGAAVDWGFHLTQNLPGAFHVDYQKTGSFPINFGVYGASVYSDPVDFVNARIGITVATVELYLYGQNLTDQNGAVYPANPFGGQPSAMRPQPRTVGLGFTWRY